MWIWEGRHQRVWDRVWKADDVEASSVFAHTYTHTHKRTLRLPTSATISVCWTGSGGGALDGREGRCRVYYSVAFRKRSLMTRLLRRFEEGLCFRTEPDLTSASVKLQPNPSSPHHTQLGCTLAPACVCLHLSVCCRECTICGFQNRLVQTCVCIYRIYI